MINTTNLSAKPDQAQSWSSHDRALLPIRCQVGAQKKRDVLAALIEFRGELACPLQSMVH